MCVWLTILLDEHAWLGLRREFALWHREVYVDRVHSLRRGFGRTGRRQ